MICVSIAERDVASCLAEAEGRQFVEIRLDGMAIEKDDIAKLFSLPTRAIATCRPGTLSDEERLRLLKCAVEAGARYVDMELESEREYADQLIHAARQSNCGIIVSHHDYERTPSMADLRSIVDRCFDAGADVAKVACMTTNESDAARVLSLYDDNRSIVALGMGELGRITRLAALFLGAPFMYVSAAKDKETARGQIDEETFNHLMEKLRSA